MKGVLISIKPKWCELIAGRRKTVEVRKTKPNLPAPFICYIYQTRLIWVFNFLRKMGLQSIADRLQGGGGKVIGEFVCHKIEHITVDNKRAIAGASCLMPSELWKYAAPKSLFDLYGWHITDLKIYDEPKPLSIFYKECVGLDNTGMCYECENAVGEECDCAVNGRLHITRPPQSWCYVEAQP